jgi:O-antigen ligase
MNARGLGACALALLPALAIGLGLALPRFALDPYPQLTGSALALCGALPLVAAVLLGSCMRRAHCELRSWAALGLGALALCFALSTRSRPMHDALEHARALALGASGLACCVAGASLGPAARAWLPSALTCLALALAGSALGAAALAPDAAAREAALAGLLGNSGLLAQAALPGAAAGVWLAIAGRGPARALGGAAAALGLAQMALAPAWASALALSLALACAAARTRARTRVLLACCAALAALAPFAARAVQRASAPAPQSSSTSANASALERYEAGGLPVRLLIWRSVLPMAAAHPGLGLGPGQFQSAYPPWRDAREIELTTRAHTLPFAEVEHAHSDPLQALAELGWPAALTWLALCAGAALAAWRALGIDGQSGEAAHGVDGQSGEAARCIDGQRGEAALGCALFACLFGSLGHAPFHHNPLAAVQGFLLLGLFLAREPWVPARVSPPRSAWRSAGLAAFALAAGLYALPRALPLLEHGAALAARQRARSVEQERAALERALDAAPHSSMARALLARQLESDPLALSAANAQWKLALVARPHAYGPLTQLALSLVRVGELDEARKQLLLALAVDPGHPGTLRNLAALEAEAGETAAARAWIGELRLRGALDAAWLDGCAAQALLRHGPEHGLALWAELDARYAAARPEELEAWGRAARERGANSSAAAHEAAAQHLSAAAHEAAAQWLWGRDHALAGRADLALRNLRQAQRQTRTLRPQGARAAQLELAAALQLAGRSEEAWAELGAEPPSASERARLPAWAAAALAELGQAVPSAR